MKLTKGKISRLYNKKRQSVKKIKRNKRKISSFGDGAWGVSDSVSLVWSLLQRKGRNRVLE